MSRVRVRWSAAGKAALVAVAGALALQLLPSLLKPPAPPPLAADVGLPAVEAAREPAVSPRRTAPPAPKARPAVRRDPTSGRRRGQLDAKIRTEPKPRRRKQGPERAAPPGAAPPTVPEPAPPSPPAAPPPPAPAPMPTAAAEPAPPSSDGSVEFAPH